MRHRPQDTHGHATHPIRLMLGLAVALLTAPSSGQARTPRSPHKPRAKRMSRVTACLPMVIIVPLIVPLAFSYRAHPSTRTSLARFISRARSVGHGSTSAGLAGRSDRHCLIWCSGLPITAGSSFLRLAPQLSPRRSSTSVRSHLSPQADGGPTIFPAGPGSLWDQTAPGEWVWNPSGDPWPLPFAASDPSGVCELYFTFAGSAFVDPASVPNGSQQCPDTTMTWLASVDTSLFGTGSMSLGLAAVDPAGLAGSAVETVNVDNAPITLSPGAQRPKPNSLGESCGDGVCHSPRWPVRSRADRL